MPRRPRMTPVRNPMANRRGFLAFVVQGLEFQTYFDPTTMSTFGLGQTDEPVRLARYPKGREPYNLERETRRIDAARARRRYGVESEKSRIRRYRR